MQEKQLLMNEAGAHKKFFGVVAIYEKCLEYFTNDFSNIDIFDEILMMNSQHNYFQMVDKIDIIYRKAYKLGLDRLATYSKYVMDDITHNYGSRYEDDYNGFCDAFNDTV
ncbi:MAG: hypothetical protein HUJ61_02520, partial [Bacilli bacterium]|nr:hypothetical protein [Bacilli bacterium]